MIIHKIMLCFNLNFRAYFNPKLFGGFSRKQLFLNGFRNYLFPIYKTYENGIVPPKGGDSC